MISASLEGVRVGISISGNRDELSRHGFTNAALNRFTVRMTRSLLAEGATLAFGHDWRPEGVMEAIASVALDYLSFAAPEEAGPRILNLVPWPETRSRTSQDLLARVRDVVQVAPAGLPADLEDQAREALEAGVGSWLFVYVRARGLSYLRRMLTEQSHARVVAGGKMEGYWGRMPGIVEEALLALDAGQPVYLIGLLGGAAKALGQVLLEDADPEILWQGLELEEIYQHWGGNQGEPLSDWNLDRFALSEALKVGPYRERLLENGLSRDENLALLNSTLEEQVIALVLRGLLRIRKSQGAP